MQFQIFELIEFAVDVLIGLSVVFASLPLSNKPIWLGSTKTFQTCHVSTKIFE
jgi:hypothetical protein